MHCSPSKCDAEDDSPNKALVTEVRAYSSCGLAFDTNTQPENTLNVISSKVYSMKMYTGDVLDIMRVWVWVEYPA